MNFFFCFGCFIRLKLFKRSFFFFAFSSNAFFFAFFSQLENLSPSSQNLKELSSPENTTFLSQIHSFLCSHLLAKPSSFLAKQVVGRLILFYSVSESLLSFLFLFFFFFFLFLVFVLFFCFFFFFFFFFFWLVSIIINLFLSKSLVFVSFSFILAKSNKKQQFSNKHKFLFFQFKLWDNNT